MQSSEAYHPSNSHFKPFNVVDTSTLTPDNPQFFQHELNLAILTKYGRYIYIRHGNQEKCSSFFATLCTIVNKLQLSFGSQEQPARLKKVRQGKLTFYVLKRQNYMYVCWTRVNHNEITIYSMIEFLHYQLKSSLTDKINNILEENQTYDPTVNFGKGRAVYSLFGYAILNGLYSLPLLFGALPSLPLKSTTRTQIYEVLKYPKEEEEGVLINILMTMSHLVSIWKRKDVDFDRKDILLILNLLQTNSSLCKTENWFPICLPGMDGEQLVFCYLKFLSEDLIQVMISDESDKFPELSEINKTTLSMLQEHNGSLLSAVNSSLESPLKTNPSLERSNMVHHFLIYSLSERQIIQSHCNNFGFNSEPDYLKYLNTYGELYEHYLKTKHNRKEKLHTQTYRDFLCGYYEDGSDTLLMLIMPAIADLEECKSVISSILKFSKEEEGNFWVRFPK